MSATTPTAKMSVAEVQQRWPQTIPVFKEHAPACLGCGLAAFCTLAEMAVYYKRPLPDLLELLSAPIKP